MTREESFKALSKALEAIPSGSAKLDLITAIFDHVSAATVEATTDLAESLKAIYAPKA